MGVTKVVRATAVELSSTSSYLPGPAWAAFRVFHWIHRRWRWLRLGKIYKNSDNFLNLAAGHGLNYLAGDSVWLRISALSVLIATRILHCAEAHDNLHESWKKMIRAFRNEFPSPVTCSWDQSTTHGLFSVSTMIWLKTSTKILLLRIQWIAISVFHVGKNAFILSMRLIDAAEAFSLNPSLGNEGINLLFVNTSEWVNKLADDQELLLDGLQSNQEVIEKILSGIGFPLTADQLIKSAEAALDKLGRLSRASRGSSQNVGEFLNLCCRKWSYEFLRKVGLHHMVSKSMVPPPSLPKHEPSKRAERFPPREWLTKPKKEKPPLQIPAKVNRPPPRAQNLPLHSPGQYQAIKL